MKLITKYKKMLISKYGKKKFQIRKLLYTNHFNFNKKTFECEIEKKNFHRIKQTIDKFA